MLRRRLPEGSRESSLWDGWLESLMILRAFLVHRRCRCPGGREAHLQQCGGQFARPFAEPCGCQQCCFQTRRCCSRSGGFSDVHPFEGSGYIRDRKREWTHLFCSSGIALCVDSVISLETSIKSVELVR